MFTGIVEDLGVVERIEQQSDAIRLTVSGSVVDGATALGDSIAVNGVCLTVATLDDPGGRGSFTADVMRQTLVATSLGGLTEGDRVNLERAATPSARLGGHIVQGHVDTTAEVLQRIPGEHWEVVEVELPGTLAPYVVSRGSITLDGVSLTVVDVGGDAFSVSLIPETLARTTLGSRAPGERLNVEVDVIAKYVERMLATRFGDQAEGA